MIYRLIKNEENAHLSKDRVGVRNPLPGRKHLGHICMDDVLERDPKTKIDFWRENASESPVLVKTHEATNISFP